MFVLQAVQLYLIGLVLGLLLQAAGPGGELVLLLPGLGADVEGQLADGRHVIDDPAQLLQFSSDAVQFPRVRGQVVPVALPGLAAVLDAPHRAHGAEHRVRHLVKDVRVFHFGL